MVCPLPIETEIGRLPPLNPEERGVSRRLAERIADEISRSGGAIDFSRFMELALYSPEFGYYTGGRQKFGAAGDFVTAPELGNLFARCLAHQIAEVLRGLGGGAVLEVGAGRGLLAADLLVALDALGSAPDQYYILETSAALAAQQRETLTARAPGVHQRVRWLQGWPDRLQGVIVGNELLDAMPVQRFCITRSGARLIGVGWRDGKFVEQVHATPAPDCCEFIQGLELPVGYVSELHVQAQAWVRSVAEVLDAGLVLLIDYGFPMHEFYHADRGQGTLMCHYRHRAHGNPYVLVGMQDITAHIDFSAIARVAQESGLDVLGYTQQAPFLLSLGLMQIVEAETQESLAEQLALAQQVKKLTLPSEMGELFKVIALGKGIAPPLSGFRLSDHRGRL